MAKISSRGEIVETSGELPEVGSAAPDFTLRKADLSPVGLADYAGKVVVVGGPCAVEQRDPLIRLAGELGLDPQDPIVAGCLFTHDGRCRRPVLGSSSR